MIAIASLADASQSDALALDGIGAVHGLQECPACHHVEFVHETLLTSVGSFEICHELTDDGECFRVRHAQGIPFGACRRDCE